MAQRLNLPLYLRLAASPNATIGYIYQVNNCAENMFHASSFPAVALIHITIITRTTRLHRRWGAVRRASFLWPDLPWPVCGPWQLARRVVRRGRGWCDGGCVLDRGRRVAPVDGRSRRRRRNGSGAGTARGGHRNPAIWTTRMEQTLDSRRRGGSQGRAAMLALLAGEKGLKWLE